MNIEKYTSALYEGGYADHARRGIEQLLARHRAALESAEKQYSRPSSAATTGTAGATSTVEAYGATLPWDESDAFIITYGDTFLPGTPPNDPQERLVEEQGVGGGIQDNDSLSALAPENKRPLGALKQFAERYLHGVASGIHILPFFPFSSDDGFSIVDYYAVNPSLGNWDDVQGIAATFRLMSDLVLNHCSARSPWFKAFLAGSQKYRHYFIDLPADSDLAVVVRPRTHPLLTEFDGMLNGQPIKRHVWTTFSSDQVDLNFGHPDVLVQMIDALLFLIENGTHVIRLDAIAYLWKELGHPSIHHNKTHTVVQLYRYILDCVAPWVILITETNVPHKENMSYVGDGNNEARMIYQFSLPPLILDAFLQGRAEHLSNWARTIPSGAQENIGYASTYFNFCASHDGIGVTPAHGILSTEELEALCVAVKERGGRINYKTTPAGDIPYELNINYFSAIAEQSLPQAMRVQKFMASQAILLSLVGIPGIYIHSLIGSENWQAGIELTGANRSINRQKLHLNELIRELNDPASLRHEVFTSYARMLRVRRGQKAFHPAGKQSVLETGTAEVFAILREAPGSSAGIAPGTPGQSAQRIICLVNTSASAVEASLGAEGAHDISSLYDVLSECSIPLVHSGKESKVSLKPWGILWLEVQ